MSGDYLPYSLEGMGYKDNLQRLCALRGLDQSELADRVGVSKSSMSRILSGLQEPKLGLVIDLARVLGVTLDAIVEGELAGGPGQQSMSLTGDEVAILQIVRRLGHDEAFRRLLSVSDSAPSS